MPMYATPPVYKWHTVEVHHLSYSATPTFVPPTPPVLVLPHNPYAPPPGSEPEPKASDDEKKDDPSASEKTPGMYIDSLYNHQV